MQPETEIRPRAMPKKELAQSYGVCVRTLLSWLKPFPEKIIINPRRRILTPAEIKIIYQIIGEP